LGCSSSSRDPRSRSFTQVNLARRAQPVSAACNGSPVAPRTYTVVIEGELGPKYTSAFPGMRLCAHEGVTDIVGVVQDQAQLRGILDAVAAYNLTLLSCHAGKEIRSTQKIE
jgi:hypothetical protein